MFNIPGDLYQPVLARGSKLKAAISIMRQPLFSCFPHFFATPSVTLDNTEKLFNFGCCKILTQCLSGG